MEKFEKCERDATFVVPCAQSVGVDRTTSASSFGAWNAACSLSRRYIGLLIWLDGLGILDVGFNEAENQAGSSAARCLKVHVAVYCQLVARLFIVTAVTRALSVCGQLCTQAVQPPVQPAATAEVRVCTSNRASNSSPKRSFPNGRHGVEKMQI